MVNLGSAGFIGRIVDNVNRTRSRSLFTADALASQATDVFDNILEIKDRGPCVATFIGFFADSLGVSTGMTVASREFHWPGGTAGWHAEALTLTLRPRG